LQNHSLKNENRDCPGCGTNNSSSADLPVSPVEWPLKTCPTCSFTYLSRVPRQEFFSEDLAWDKTFAAEEERRLASRGMLKRAARQIRSIVLPVRLDVDYFLRANAKDGRVLDVGVSNGKYLLRLVDRFVPFGVEISKEAAHRTNARFKPYGGAVVHAPALEGIASFDERFFSGVILRSYLEHEYKPGPVLNALHRVLDLGGVAVIKVPNYGSLNRKIFGASWCGYRFPDHVNYFTRKSLTKMLSSNGFEVNFVWHKSLPTSDNMTCIARRVD